jgi:hypothetical protein
MAKLIQQVRTNGSGETLLYRVWNAINPPGNMDYYSVENPEEACRLIQELIQEQVSDPSVFMNAFGLEELEADGEYHEWYSEIDDENIQDTEEFIQLEDH